MTSRSDRDRSTGSLIITKLIIGTTGILLFLYLILHIVGNALIFFGRDIFNTYSYKLISNPLVVPVEIGLLIVFLIHIFKAVPMTVRNQAARAADPAGGGEAGPPEDFRHQADEGGSRRRREDGRRGQAPIHPLTKDIGINGAAARLVHPGDVVILIAYLVKSERRELLPQSVEQMLTVYAVGKRRMVV